MTPASIVYTRHAEEMLVERRLSRSWVERTLTNPDKLEPDPKRPNVLRAYRRIPERGGLWLRVAYVHAGDSARVITVFFDRAQRHKP
jgi:hypothetical protein